MMKEKVICKYKAVSFDIFDTLVERNVDVPEDIFKKVGERTLGKENAESFCIQRKNAELRARKMQDSGEVTLDQIYVKLGLFYDEQTTNLLKKMEIETELESCYKKKSTQELYNICLKLNKDIYLVSDMYLPYEVIEEILKKSGINGYKKLYISNVYGKNKITGELFGIVLSENNLKSNEIMHIGDSIRADFIGAYKVGIKSHLIKRKNRMGRLMRL